MGKGRSFMTLIIKSLPIICLSLVLSFSSPLVSHSVSSTASVMGNTFYVDGVNGSDTNPGTTRDQAWRTIQKAADSMAPGDTTTVLAASADEKVQVTISGTSGAPITFQTEGTIVMEGFTINANYINVIGFEITNTPDIWDDGWGIYIKGSNCDIERNYIHFATRGGIRIDPVSNNCTIRDNRLYRNATAGIWLDGENNIVEGNEIWGTIQYHPNWNNPPNSVDADGMRFFGNGHIIRKNYIHDIIYSDPENIDPHIDCFQTYGPAYDIIFEKNICYNPNTYGDNQILILESINSPVQDIIFRNNIFVMNDPGYSPMNFHRGDGRASISNMTIVNNTIVHSNSIGSYGITFINITTAIVKNNLFIDYGNQNNSYVLTSSNSTNINIGYNAVYKTDGIAPLGGPHLGDIWMQDPRVQNYNGLDFHLNVFSPLIDVGYDVGNLVVDDFDGLPRPLGPGFDIGANEYLPYQISTHPLLVHKNDTLNIIVTFATNGQPITITSTLPTQLDYLSSSASCPATVSYSDESRTVTLSGNPPAESDCNLPIYTQVNTDEPIAVTISARIDNGFDNPQNISRIITLNGFPLYLPLIRKTQ